ISIIDPPFVKFSSRSCYRCYTLFTSVIVNSQVPSKVKLIDMLRATVLLCLPLEVITGETSFA
ncbi:MAG: hypothetical protein ACREIQ_02900, partial [Nitrospiria bacterium]